LARSMSATRKGSSLSFVAVSAAGATRGFRPEERKGSGTHLL
jgi:hypothetical protein